MMPFILGDFDPEGLIITEYDHGSGDKGFFSRFEKG
jgi:hypothetical protein